jgi:hypothetical protein
LSAEQLKSLVLTPAVSGKVVVAWGGRAAPVRLR